MSIKQLASEHLIIRFPQSDDALKLQVFEEQNRTYWASWESTPLNSSTHTFLERLETWEKEREENKAARFFLFKKDDPQRLIGLCNFTQIFYGAFQACYLGYKIDQSLEGKGLMFEALQPTIRYIFEELRLHRIMANYMPVNIRSANLLKRLGFAIEGYAKDYLFINNRWEDHVLTALTYERWKNSTLSQK